MVFKNTISFLKNNVIARLAKVSFVPKHFAAILLLCGAQYVKT